MQKVLENVAARRKQVHDVIHAAASHQRQLAGDAYRCVPLSGQHGNALKMGHLSATACTIMLYMSEGL